MSRYRHIPFVRRTPKLSDGLSRRDWLRLSALGVLGASSSGLIPVLAQQAAAAKSAGKKTKACIALWMNGGASQTHTFDMKETSEYKAISTTVPGMQFCEYLPKLAQHAQDLAVIRSMSTGNVDHDSAKYLLHTGYPKQGGLSYPALGCIASRELGDPEFELPNFVVVKGERGLANGGAFRSDAAHLGPKHAPLVLIDLAKGVPHLRSPVDDTEFQERVKLLDEAERNFRDKYGMHTIEEHRMSYVGAARLMKSPKAKAFNLDLEKDSVRDAYGRNYFGQGCLLARRLVEVGVPFVEVNFNGWDDHGQGVAGKNVKQRCPMLEQAWVQLLVDLKERGLLDDTLIVWMGEFGREPTKGGDDHYAKAWSTVLAGAGLKTGQVIGATDKTGRDVTDNPVDVPGFLATLCKALGIDFAKEYETRDSRPVRIVKAGGEPIKALF